MNKETILQNVHYNYLSQFFKDGVYKTTNLYAGNVEFCEKL